MLDENLALVKGVYPVLPTIFDTDGNIDLDGFDKVLDYVIGSGADGVVFPGLASEAKSLTKQERLELTEYLGKKIGGRVNFVVGASAENPEDSIEFAMAGQKAGAIAAMIITPTMGEGSVEALLNFYRVVGEKAGIPIMLQNAPKPNGLGLSVDDIAALAGGVPEIYYVKEETMPCGQRITAMEEKLGDRVKGVLGGAGGRYILDELNRGAMGTLPACEISEIHVKMYSSYHDGDLKTAYDLFERSLPLLVMQAIFRWRLTKEVLKRRGLIDSSYTRAPGPELDPQDLEEITTLIGRLGLDL